MNIDDITIGEAKKLASLSRAANCERAFRGG